MVSLTAECKSCQIIFRLDTSKEFNPADYEGLYMKCPKCGKMIEVMPVRENVGVTEERMNAIWAKDTLQYIKEYNYTHINNFADTPALSFRINRSFNSKRIAYLVRGAKSKHIHYALLNKRKRIRNKYTKLIGELR